MNQKTRSLVTLAALAAAACGVTLFAYFGVHLEEEQKSAREEKENKLFAFDAKKIAALTVSTNEGRTMLAPAGDGSWSVVSPLQTAADREAVETLVERLVGLEKKAVVEEAAEDLARYGLEHPSVQVTARLEDGVEHTLRLGLENTFDGSSYASVDGSPRVVQVEPGVKWALEKSTLDLREKRIAPFEDGKVRSLSVSLGEKRYVLKKEGTVWKLMAPLSDRADELTVSRLLGALRTLKAIRFATDLANPLEDEKYGLTEPRLEAVVTLHDGTRYTVVIGQAEIDGEGHLFARRKESTTIAEVPDAVLRELDVGVFELRNKRVMAFDRERVEKIRFASADGLSLEIARKRTSDAGVGDDWQFTGPEPGAAQKWKVSSLLWALASMRAIRFADENPTDLAPYGLEPAERTVTLVGPNDVPLGTLFIGRKEGSRVFVRSSSDAKVFEIDESSLRDLPSSRTDLEEKAGADAGAAG